MELSEIREKIDAVDEQLLDLFLQRMDLSDEVAAYKNAHHLPILNKERERAILAKVTEKSGERERYAYHLFSTLFELARSRQAELISAPTKVAAQVRASLEAGTSVFPQTGLVACQGVEGANSQVEAIGQCSKFLNSLNGVRVIPCDNTAMAAKMVAEKGDRHAAAISSHPCAALYGLTCLNDSIQDSDNNYTRFICITKDPVIYAGANRISLIIAFDNRPGALYEILSKLAALDINMTKLESCPVAGSDFEFVFFLELDASVQDPSVLAMLEEMERSCAEFQFLGNYAEV